MHESKWLREREGERKKRRGVAEQDEKMLIFWLFLAHIKAKDNCLQSNIDHSEYINIYIIKKKKQRKKITNKLNKNHK